MPLLSEEWLLSLSNITAPSESLKYDEAYVDLKNKMSQVSFNPDDMIRIASHLLTRSHDWQLCQFLLLACAAGGYLDDFNTAMKSYVSVLSQGEQSYPQTSKGRQAAVYWLNQSAIIELLQQHKEKISEAWLVTCKETWTALQSHLKSFFEEELLSWHVLGKWLEQTRPITTPIEMKVEAPIIPIVQMNHNIENDIQAAELAERLWEYYSKKENKLKAMCISRSNAWARASIPQEQYGKTWVSPLRQADAIKLQHLNAQSQWDLLWDFAEQCFMQEGGPFDVKLQYYIIQSLEQLNKPEILSWAKGFFITWTDTYPSLLDMHFNDGSPFCDDSIRSWVSSLKAPLHITTQKDERNRFEETEYAILKKQKDAIVWLAEFVPASYGDKIWQQYLWVLSDFKSKNIEHAWRCYQVLLLLCEEKELFSWNSDLMKKIWTLGVEMSERKGVRYEQVLNQIIKHDFLFAGNVA